MSKIVHKNFVLILGSSIRHSLFLYEILRCGFVPKALVVVKSKNPVRQLRKSPSSTIVSILQTTYELIRTFFALRNAKRFMHKLNFIEVNDVNDNKVIELLLVTDPSLVFVYGSNIIKAELLDIDTLWLNAHGGILPGYRGLDSNLWAIAENKLDKVGVTVHVVNNRVDAGDIIWTERVEVQSILSLLSIRLKIAQIMAFKFNYFLTIDSFNISKVSYRHNVKESTYRSGIVARALVRALGNLLNRKEQA